MADSKKTKLFTSTMPGAPVLSGTAGSLIAVLDAVLVNGFGLVSVTGLTVTGGIATATVSAGHSLQVDSVGLIAGAAPAGLNGEKRILSIAGNSFTFDATGIADQTATGTITAKVAPAGWTKAFSGTNLAAYKITAPEGTGFYLRVDDTGALSARVVGYEDMSDINTGTGPFPSAAQVPGGGYWAKSGAANAMAIPWVVPASDTLLYFCNAANFLSGATYTNMRVSSFGDFAPYKSTDAYRCQISAGLTSGISDISGNLSASVIASIAAPSQGTYVARAFTALGGSQQFSRVGTAALSNTSPPVYSGDTGYGLGSYPNGADNGLLLGDVLLYEGANETVGTVRGVYPGLLHAAQSTSASTFSTGDRINGSGAYAGRKLIAVKAGHPNLNGSPGVVFFDATGPWGA